MSASIASMSASVTFHHSFMTELPFSSFDAPLPSSADAPELIKCMKPPGLAGDLKAGDALDRVGTPVGAHVGEYRRTVRDEVQKQHSETVEVVILGRENERRALAVPVKRRVEYSLGEVSVRHIVGPLALTLESAEDSVAAVRLLDVAHFGELRVAEHNVADDERHLRDKLPLLLVLCGVVLPFGRIDLETLRAVLLDPREFLLVFVVVVDAEVYAAENLNHVDPLGADSEILLHEVGICERAGDTHCDRAETAVRLAAHESYRDSAACEAEDLLLDVAGMVVSSMS